MESRFNSILIISFFLITILCCSCSQQNSGWKGTIEEVGGVTVVKNPKEPIYGEEVFSLEEELSIGEVDGREEYMFSQLGNVKVDEEERIYVLDTKEAHIKIFDRDGAYLKTVSKKGQGPGELGLPRPISITSKNEIMIPDLMNRRLTFFSLEGEFIKNISTAEMSLFSTKIDTQGNIIGMVSVREEGNSRYELKKFDPDLNYIYSIASSPLPTINNFDPFMAVLRWDLNNNDQVVFGYPKTYEIRISDSDGNEVKKITKEYDPVEVTQEEIEELEEMPPGIKVSMSKFHPAYNRIFVDDELRIFVSTWEKIKEGEGYYYDVFDGDGKYIAKIPLKVRPQTWKNGKLYTIEEDEDGFQYVKRYRVTWKF